MNNKSKLTFLALQQNEAFARNVAASFIAGLNPTIEEINDVKTAVSEAVTNCIVHGYDGESGTIEMDMEIEQSKLIVKISDSGIGILDIDKAMQPFYSTKKNQDRSGMGFTIMECLMDDLSVKSNGKGLDVLMEKKIGC